MLSFHNQQFITGISYSYLIEVRQTGPDGVSSSGWLVTRRYSEFFALSATLRERYPALRQIDFPSKRLVTSMADSFVQQRKVALEKYLQVCRLICLKTYHKFHNYALRRL